jgi:hypothetical protein
MKICLYLLHFTSHVGKSWYRRCGGNCEFHKNERQEGRTFPLGVYIVTLIKVKPYVMLNVQSTMQSWRTVNSFLLDVTVFHLPLPVAMNKNG